MRVLQVVPSLCPSHGGPTRAVLGLADALTTFGVDVTVATTTGQQDDESDAPRSTSYDIRRFAVDVPFYSFSSRLHRWLRTNVHYFDVVHVHELFTHPSSAGGWAATKSAIPYVLTPHGVLMRWGRLNRRRHLKRLSIPLIERRLASRAQVVHFTSDREQDESRDVVAPLRSFVAPFGVELAEFAAQSDSSLWHHHGALRHRPYILVLCRLHPVKGIELALSAFQEVHRKVPELMLVIAGDGDPGYVHQLGKLTANLGLTSHVVFTGFLDAQGRVAALQGARCLVHASRSESLGVAVVEAMAAAVPVVVTDGVGVEDQVSAAGAGLSVAQDTGNLAKAILEIVLDEGRGQAMGQRGRALATQCFSTQQSSARLLRCYETAAREHS